MVGSMVPVITSIRSRITVVVVAATVLVVVVAALDLLGLWRYP
jgi:hypothetical protein